MPEADVVRNITEQMITGRVLFDAYINDADFIGTHIRLNRIVSLDDYILDKGKEYTDPYLDMEDIINREVAQGWGDANHPA